MNVNLTPIKDYRKEVLIRLNKVTEHLTYHAGIPHLERSVGPWFNKDLRLFGIWHEKNKFGDWEVRKDIKEVELEIYKCEQDHDFSYDWDNDGNPVIGGVFVPSSESTDCRRLNLRVSTGFYKILYESLFSSVSTWSSPWCIKLTIKRAKDKILEPPQTPYYVTGLYFDREILEPPDTIKRPLSEIT